MREMKDSGVAWIGEIPKSWNLERLQWHISEIKETNKPEKTKQILSLTNKRGVIPYEEKGAQGNVSKEDLSQYKLAYPDTIVANSMNVLIGSVGKCNYYGCVSPVYYVYKPNDGENLEFINYIFQTEQFQKELRRYANGILEIRLRVSSDGILKRKVAFPSTDEQQKIVVYLNQKLSQVDSLIANVQAQIEKLKTYKQSLITEVVTKGLDPNAPMKDSGVEWAPKIPANWEMSRIGLHYSIILGKMLCPKPADDSYTLEPYYCAANVHFGNICSDELKKMWFSPYEKELYHVEVGDVLIVEGGAGAGGCAVVQQPTETLVQNSVMIVRNKSNSDNRYLRYWVESLVGRGYIEVVCNKATIPHFTKEKLSRTVYPVMSPKEQVQIADFLDKKCSQIEQLITLKESKIEKLQQYKRSLIYEYVTGKKEVV